MSITKLAALSALAVGVGTALALSSGASAWADPWAAAQIFVNTELGTTLTLDVEGSDSIENVLQKINDKNGLIPDHMCLTYNNHRLITGATLIDFNVQPNDTVDEWHIPVTAAWSITPDDHIVGNTVHNYAQTNPPGSHFAVVDGALPAGVTLDETTGIVDGTFISADPFSVTIRVTTLCGDADLAWSSSGAKALPDTGLNEASFTAAGVGALAAIALGAIALRRRSSRAER